MKISDKISLLNSAAEKLWTSGDHAEAAVGGMIREILNEEIEEGSTKSEQVKAVRQNLKDVITTAKHIQRVMRGTEAL